MKDMLKFKNKYLRYAYIKAIRTYQIKKEDFILNKSSNLFVSGTSGRSGTTWLMHLLEDLFKDQNYISIGETGFFVLNQFRKAAYEFYQPTPGDELNRKKYWEFFNHFVLKWGYKKQKIYGQGLKGLKLIIPKRAIKIASRHLYDEIKNTATLKECLISFGKFYSNLLNFHSLLYHNTTKWFSKEPGYGPYAEDLYNLIPTSINLVLVRDGRDVALSMAKRGWCNSDLIRCMNRWNDFTRLALEAKEKVPKNNYLLIRYEDLVNNFEEEVEKIVRFYQLEFTTDIENKIKDENYKFKPKEMNFGKWKKEYTKKEKTYFEDLCGDLLSKLGYE